MRTGDIEPEELRKFMEKVLELLEEMRKRLILIQGRQR